MERTTARKFEINIEHYCQERLYKILNHNAQSCHNGSFDWNPYLPKYQWNKDWTGGKWIPGPWIEHKGDLQWCNSGFHLTSHPLRWKVKHGRVFLAEYDGEWIQNGTTDKICFRKVRLVAELGIDSFDLDVKIFKLITSKTDLSYADLSSADLSYADLSSANLSYADLSSANLSYADLSSANLRYANLSSANLSSANLSYADLSSANLSSAVSLEGCYIHNDPQIKGYKFDNGRLWRAE